MGGFTPWGVEQTSLGGLRVQALPGSFYQEIPMRFSRIAVLSLLAAGALTLGGCNCAECADKDTNAGMVGNKACTEGTSCSKDASMGAVSDKASGCCKSADKASMGAVSEKKTGCCKGEKTTN